MRQTVPNLPSTTALLAGLGASPITKPKPECVEDKPETTIAPKTWTRLIGLIADGIKIPDAVATCKIARHTLEGTLRTNAKMKEQWDDAKIASVRRLWDFDVLEEIFADIAMGKGVKDSVNDRGLSPHGFYKLVLADALMREMYDDALKIQAETMSDEIIAISDYAADDQWFDVEKGIWKTNSEVVNRSRLKVDARKWKMAKLHSKRFGDKIQQDVTATLVVDHAARLEEARKRVEEGRRVVSTQ